MAHLRGGKRRRSGGTLQNLPGRGSLKDRVPRAPYIAQHYYYAPWLETLERRPISEAAKDLLGEYLRRQAFWWAVEQFGCPPGFAGAALLGGVSKRRVQQVLAELDEAGGPYRWFVLRAIEGLKSGKIARGRATAFCAIADQFFNCLAGGEEVIEELQARAFGGVTSGQVVGEYEGVVGIGLEVLEYSMCKHLPPVPAKGKVKRG